MRRPTSSGRHGERVGMPDEAAVRETLTQSTIVLASTTPVSVTATA